MSPTETPIQLLNQTEFLQEICIKALNRFFDIFKPELQARNLPVPIETPGSGAYYDEWAQLLAQPQLLPAAMVDAVLAIEQLAEDRPRLKAEVARVPTAVYFDHTALPVCQALQLWLWWRDQQPKEPPVAAQNGHQPGASLQPAATRNMPLPDNCRPGPPTGRFLTEAQTAVNDPTPLPPVSGPESTPCAQVACPVPEPGKMTPAQLTPCFENGPVTPHEGTPPAETPPLPDNCRPGPPTGRSSTALPQRQSPSDILERANVSPAPVPTLNQKLAPSFSHRPTGKVGRLSHELREKINLMLRDGLPYASIIAQLGDPGKELTYHNLKSWRKGGYQEWLQKQERTDRARAKEEFALEILREKDASKMHEAVLQVTAAQLCQFLAEFDAATLKEKLQGDPHNFGRLLALLPKLSDSGMKCENHRLE